MADTKISALAAASGGLLAADEFAIHDASSAASRKVTATDIATFLQTNLGLPKVTTLTSAYTNSTTTGTEVTGLSFTGLVAGTYYVRWVLLTQSAATTTSIKLGVNYTGTVTRMNITAQFPSAGVTAVTGTWHDANNATTGQVWGYNNTRTESTTAPNLGPWVGVTNANVDHFCVVEGVVVVSDSGDLELWAASEVAAQMTLSAGSSGLCWRCN